MKQIWGSSDSIYTTGAGLYLPIIMTSIYSMTGGTVSTLYGHPVKCILHFAWFLGLDMR